MILSTDDGLDYHVNVWNWGVLHHMVAIENIFPEEIWEPLYYNLGYELNAEQVTILADFLETKLLPSLKAGERLFFNGTITNEPDDGTFYRDEKDVWRNYSLHHHVLVQIINFLRNTNGYVKFL